MKKVLVLYHERCQDGFTAAWTARKKFGSRAEYVPVGPEELPPRFPKNYKEVYALDVCYPIDVQKKLRRANGKVVVLDHHASLGKETEFFPENVFDNDHSGAVIAWRYFFPKKKMPKLFRYIEDLDFWRFRLPFINEMKCYINSKDLNFREWDALVREVESPIGFKRCILAGRAILGYEASGVKDIVEQGDVVLFEGRKILAVNSSFKRLTSEVGGIFLKLRPPVALVWYEKHGVINVSLRGNGKVDVSKIAVKYGGGGHKNAAGFSFPADKKFPWKRVK